MKNNITPLKYIVNLDNAPEIEVEIEIDKEETTEFYIEFYANDDEDDFNNGEYENILCGKFKIKKMREGVFPVEITVANKIIGKGYVTSYPDKEKKYEAPLYEMIVSGKDDGGKNKSYNFSVIRYGVERNIAKNIGPRIVGLS